MSAKMEYSGKDVAEAIRFACEKLNVAREDLEIEIMDTGSAGIFGLCKKKAKIMVSVKGDSARGKKSAKKIPSPGKSDRNNRRPVQPSAGSQKPSAALQGKEISEEPIIVAESTLAEVKADLTKLVSLMGFSIDVTVSAEGNKIKAHITGDNLDDVIGPEGQTLDGLQFLLRKIISRKFPEKLKFTLDAGDFRENRARELEEMSLRLAEEVKETGKTRSIPALNPAERRIVHMVLQNDNTIRSRSVGDGLFKKILIYLPGKGRKKGPRKRKSSYVRA